MSRDRFFNTTLNCESIACLPFQPGCEENSARKHSQEQKSVRRIVGGATRHTCNTISSIFLDGFDCQELLELFSNDSDLNFLFM